MITEHFTTIANALRSRYRLERVLQSGCAAYVYAAEDRTLGRPVAIKVLREEMSSTVNAARFMAEIRLAGELRHPNIVPVYDSGDIDGLPYYVMPFIEGESLRTRLARVGRLPLTDALHIAQDVARALDFAHRHHVVHRDIKPENVMLSRGRALVLDFGIALALDALEGPRHTLPGLTLGTIHYMSPEQVDPDGEVDGRSDVYSLACVVYEMLCGNPPFTGRPNAVIRRHLSVRPRPLGTVCPGVPQAIGSALSRGLQKSADDRYPSAGAMVTALQAGCPRVRVIGRSVAVIPFVNLSGDPAVDTLSDGTGEEIAGALREFDGLIIAPGGTIAPNEPAIRVIELARRVRADVVVFGNVRRSDDGANLMVSASVYDGRTGARLWAGAASSRCHSALGERNSAAECVADCIARALGVTRSSNHTLRHATPVTPLHATAHQGDAAGRSAAR